MVSLCGSDSAWVGAASFLAFVRALVMLSFLYSFLPPNRARHSLKGTSPGLTSKSLEIRLAIVVRGEIFFWRI